MKSKTHEFKGKVFAEIPKEVVEKLGIKPGDEVEFQPVYKNLVLITPAEKEGLSEQEENVLKKINSIKYYERTEENIARILTEEERKIFDELFLKKILYKYEKNKKQLIGIAKEYFKHVVEEARKEEPLIEKLEEQGFLILESQAEVAGLTKKLRALNISVQGIRGFDRKFYFIMPEKLSELEDRLTKTLEKEKFLKNIAEELRISEELCKAAIEVLREQGKILEKKKDVYVLA